MVWVRDNMGTPHSTPEQQEPEVAVSPYTARYKRLYQELTAPDHTGAPADDKIFRNRFENYYGGPYLEFGHLLYTKLFGTIVPVEEEMFVSAMTVLERLSNRRGEHLAAESFYFTVFTEGKETIDKQHMIKILHVAATVAMVMGSELHEKAVLPKDHFILDSITNAAMLHVDKTTGELHKAQFIAWVSGHCPRLLEGIQHWALSLLHPHRETPPPASDMQPQEMFYQLPTPHLEGEHQLAREVELCTLIWALSTILPLVFMGHKEDGRKQTKPEHDHPIGGSWTLLYSSNQHGFSMNRFQHHCSDYREPSIMFLTCRHTQENEKYMFAIAVDTDWRNGSYYWGGEKFCFVQLQPTFRLMKSGPKLVSLNEKQRGFPTGLRVMSSDKYDLCILHVEPTLENAHFEGIDMVVELVEVWGCGGMEAAESQRRVKDWERREILRRRNVNRAKLAGTWETNPDRYLLELGGVTTRRPTEQQQQ